MSVVKKGEIIQETDHQPKMGLLVENPVYKPFRYPWCYDAWLTQQRIHWLPEEVPLGDDVRDWQKHLSKEEKNLLTQIFRFFTQSDVEVNDNYMERYSQVFKPTEVKMMMSAFSNIETVHIAAYALLLETIGMPDTEFSAFLKYKEMADKHDYMQQFTIDSNHEIAKTVAMFGGFTEGLQLFASFAMLLNFPRHNKMRGMGQIVTWSIVDETQHAEAMIKLFRTYIEENREVWTDDLKSKIYTIATRMVELEDKFIDLAFKMGPMEDLTADDVKKYIRYICDRRLISLGLKGHYKVKRNPLPWVEEMINAPTHTNFFENRATDYAKGALKGKWDDVWGKAA